MNAARPNSLENFLTLKQASEKLNVSIETLLSWNQSNILKPTITQDGDIGYTQQQLDQFLTIRQQLLQIPTPASSSEPTQTALPISPSYPPPTPKSPGIKPHLPVVMILLVAVFFVLTIVFFPQPSTQTSKLKLSGFSALPIQLRHDEARKNLQSEGETISRQRINAPKLYAAKSEKEASNNQMAVLAARRPTGTTSVDNSYASSVNFRAPEDESVIDQNGNIQGEAKIDTLASILGGIDEIVKNDSLNSDTTNQFVLIFMGALGVLFLFQKQFAFPMRRSHMPQLQTMPVASYYEPRPALQKILEVDQKTDGTVVLNFQGKEYKVSKPEMNSESDQFIETLMTLTQGDMKELEYDTATSANLRLTTPLSRLVTRLGFVGLKRDIFFPRTAKSSVLFRRYLTPQDLADMNLTIDQLSQELLGSTN